MSAKYIVTFKDHVTDEEISSAITDLEKNGGSLGQRYSLVKGFVATIPDAYLQSASFQSLQGSAIESIELDSVVTIQRQKKL